MDEPITYTYILVKTDDNKYTGWSKAPKKPDDVKGLKWYSWGKELPDDIDDTKYIYKNGKLVKG